MYLIFLSLYIIIHTYNFKVQFYSFMFMEMKNAIKNYCKVDQFYNKNQFVIDGNDFIIFQSYQSIICIIDHKQKIITFGKHYDYSKTTSKHLKLFLNVYLNFYYDSKKDLEKSIKDGFIQDYKVIFDKNLI